MTTKEKLEAIKEINERIEGLDGNMYSIEKGDYFSLDVEMEDHSLREVLAEYFRAKRETLFLEAEKLMK
jgi:DNA-directed RNA polymerase subunit L